MPYTPFVRAREDAAEDVADARDDAVCFAFELFFVLGSPFGFDSRLMEDPFGLVVDLAIARCLFVGGSFFDSGSFLPAFGCIPRMKDGSEPSMSLASLPFGVMW